jgi:hypothetical protein
VARKSRDTARLIVVLSLTNAAEIKDCFQPDPFVQNDILAAEAYFSQTRR